MTRTAEAIKRLVIEKQKADDEAFEEFVKAHFQQYSTDVQTSWKEWEHAYTEWRTQRQAHEPAAAGPPQRPPTARGQELIAAARLAYEKHLEISNGWIVPEFQA